MHLLVVLLATLCLSVIRALADPMNWVNPAYVLSKSSTVDTTSAARQTIVSRAGSSARSGPWTLTKQSILPPSGDSRDYLSWAPYHWPDCNWCSRSRSLASRGEIMDREHVNNSTGQSCVNTTSSEADDVCETELIPEVLPVPARLRFPVPVNGTRAPRHFVSHLRLSPRLPASGPTSAPLSTPTPLATDVPGISSSYSRSNHVYSSDSSDPNAQIIARTTTSTCTPSPTRSLAPSATWTTCPYKTLDGQVNPDVREPQGVNYVMAVTQSVLYNVLASVFSGSKSYASTASSFIEAFFLDSKTGMRPGLNYAQLVRGPGATRGQFMGVLDMRGMIQVVNSILIMRAAQVSAWTSAMDTAMISWTKAYINWLETSPIGKAASQATNNHGTFYHGQLAALQVLVGDEVGARQTIKDFFTGTFRDQIAVNGEQPWEAVRKGRSFHYRCFNLEALFAIGKIADQLGLNVWIAKTKSGATIQDAVDYTMTVPPGKEDVTELVPHVAAASAIYGDSNGKYATFLQNTEPSYKSQSFWYYDQPSACTFSTAALNTNRMTKVRRDQTFETYNLTMVYPACLSVENGTDSCTNPTTIPLNVTDPYKPAIFYSVELVQLDDDTFVTWPDIEPFYQETA